MGVGSWGSRIPFSFFNRTSKPIKASPSIKPTNNSMVSRYASVINTDRSTKTTIPKYPSVPPKSSGLSHSESFHPCDCNCHDEDEDNDPGITLGDVIVAEAVSDIVEDIIDSNDSSDSFGSCDSSDSCSSDDTSW